MSDTFDLLDRPLVFIPVRWSGLKPADDGTAEVVEHLVEIQVDILDKDEIAEWLKLSNGTVDEDKQREHALNVFRTVAKGWRKIKAKGRAVEFDDENIYRLLRWPGFDTAFSTAYWEAWQGRTETREKNSASSPADGRADESSASAPDAPIS